MLLPVLFQAYSPLEVIDALDDAFDSLSSYVSKTLFRRISETLDADVHEQWAVLRYEFFVIDLVRSAQICH